MYNAAALPGTILLNPATISVSIAKQDHFEHMSIHFVVVFSPLKGFCSQTLYSKR